MIVREHTWWRITRTFADGGQRAFVLACGGQTTRSTTTSTSTTASSTITSLSAPARPPIEWERMPSVPPQHGERGPQRLAVHGAALALARAPLGAVATNATVQQTDDHGGHKKRKHAHADTTAPPPNKSAKTEPPGPPQAQRARRATASVSCAPSSGGDHTDHRLQRAGPAAPQGKLCIETDDGIFHYYRFVPHPQPTSRCCVQCRTCSTPEWRRGPAGVGTLCNACGLRWKATVRRQAKQYPQPPTTPAPNAHIDPTSSSARDAIHIPHLID